MAVRLRCALRTNLRLMARPLHSGSELYGPDASSIVGEYSPITWKLWQDRLQLEHQDQTNAAAPKITPKPPHTTTVIYAFSADKALKEQYRNPWGGVRIGRLLEDLDSLAGNVAMAHCDDSNPDTRMPILVTAAVDAISLLRTLTLDDNIVMSGRVVWTGSSSMDIQMELHQEAHESQPSLVALFTFVARDPVSQRGTPVNPVVPQTAEDERLFRERQELADARKAARQAGKDGKVLPSPEALAHVDRLLAEAQVLKDIPSLAPDGAMLMTNTRMQNIFICQPQQRNMHGRVFGGFLMRRAYELAFATTYIFAGSRPRFVEVEAVKFQRPVDIGDLLRFKSAVMHTRVDASLGRGLVATNVEAAVTQPERVCSAISNTFQFVFAVDLRDSEGRVRALKNVLPSSRDEALEMLQYCPPHQP